MKKPFKTVFMGTPEFAVPSLEFLYDSGRDISCVVTQPDRPKGRGRKPAPSPVKITALRRNLQVYEVESIRNPSVVDTLSKFKPDLFIVVAFGQILPKKILDIPGYGSVNIHASLLPKYRGAAPIQWAIVNRENKTGVTAILMDEGMDTGGILRAAAIPIRDDETFQGLHDRLSVLGAQVLMETLHEMETRELLPFPQDETQVSYAPMLKKEDGRIDWRQSGKAIDALIRGMTPWPGAFTFIEMTRIKIFRAAVVDVETDQPPGTVVRADPEAFWVSTGNRVLSILEIQPASGKRLMVRDFMRGRGVYKGACLT
ncbi:MAG: methionyl-tRNA formyltransferase [Thermodesulfobacteriota bacterium]